MKKRRLLWEEKEEETKTIDTAVSINAITPETLMKHFENWSTNWKRGKSRNRNSTIRTKRFEIKWTQFISIDRICVLVDTHIRRGIAVHQGKSMKWKTWKTRRSMRRKFDSMRQNLRTSTYNTEWQGDLWCTILQFLGDIMVKVASLLVLYDSERSNRSVYTTVRNSNLSCFLDGTDFQYTERFCHKSMYSGCFQSCLGNMHLNCNRWRVLYHSHLSSRKTRDAHQWRRCLFTSLLGVVVLFLSHFRWFCWKEPFACHGTPGHIWSISPDALNEKKEELSLHYSVWNTAI